MLAKLLPNLYFCSNLNIKESKYEIFRPEGRFDL